MADTVAQVQRAFTAYTVERELGRGGMAIVYLAHDKKHDRKVAIKVLHAELAAVLGAERFLQEIRVTANLQHPHILGLIDSGVIGEDGGELRGRPYYVMPFVEGESLRQRLDKEQQLPVSDSVRIATEVASALDYAHRHGVVHRDIKPENILLHDGSAIVADFGIALAVTQAGGARITQTGLSLGTPGYMSPEQAMGERTITARSDIYSLGAVTYEMLSGEPPFTGPTVQAVVARVMTEEPRPLTAQRRSVPAHVDAAVGRALEKVPADRFATAHEFGEALNNPSFARQSAATPSARSSSRREKWMLYGATGLAALFLAIALWGWMRPAAARPVVRYQLVFDSTEALVPGASWWTRVALSPDGSRLAYVGGPRGQVLVQTRNQLRVTPMPGSDGAMSPFFSPDGSRVGYLHEAVVRVAPADGGPPITMSETLTGVAGASWGRDGFIYVDGQQATPLLRVEAKPGATPKWFTALDTAKGEVDHTWPEVLPNAKAVLFAIQFTGKNAATAATTFAIGVADIPSGRHRVLIQNATHPKYTASGHLLYVTPNRTLMMVPFDQNSQKVTGEPVALIEGMRLGGLGAADLAVSEGGTLLYGMGGGEGQQELVWVTREGKAQPVDPDWPGNFWQPSLSPDGKQVTVGTTTVSSGDEIWTKQLDRGPSIKLTSEERQATDPTWTADGRSVTFSTSTDLATSDIWTRRADGSSQAVLQLRAKGLAFDPRWSADGSWLVFTGVRSPTESDIVGMRPGIDSAPSPLVATKSIELSPTLSPDGHWLAYASNETGRYEIYVVPFPNTGSARWAISTRGGTAPLWSRRVNELFYRDFAWNLVSVQLKTSPTFSVVRSTPLFPMRGFRNGGLTPQYAISPDNSRFLMIRPLTLTLPDKLVVVENWFEELKAKSRK